MSQFDRAIQRRRQLLLPPFDIHYRRPLMGAIGSKLVGVAPAWVTGATSDWLPPRLSRIVGRVALRLGDALLVRSRPLYSIDRRSWYSSSEWQRRFETEDPSQTTTEARAGDFDGIGEVFARAEDLAASIGWRVTHLGRYSPEAEVTWEATARPNEAVDDEHEHGSGETAVGALDELIRGLDRQREEADRDDSDAIDHVASLVIELMNAESARLQLRGLTTAASRQTQSGSMTELILEAQTGVDVRRLAVSLRPLDWLTEIHVRIVTSGAASTSVGTAIVAAIDVPQVALALTRAAITSFRAAGSSTE